MEERKKDMRKRHANVDLMGFMRCVVWEKTARCILCAFQCVVKGFIVCFSSCFYCSSLGVVFSLVGYGVGGYEGVEKWKGGRGGRKKEERRHKLEKQFKLAKQQFNDEGSDSYV